MEIVTLYLKLASVSATARQSAEQAVVHGDEVQSPLLRNPYTHGSKEALDYENGYEFAHSIGHMGLASMPREAVAKWTTAALPWRKGFASAATNYGLKSVADIVMPTENTKQTKWATKYLQHKQGSALASVTSPAWLIGGLTHANETRNIARDLARNKREAIAVLSSNSIGDLMQNYTVGFMPAATAALGYAIGDASVHDSLPDQTDQTDQTGTQGAGDGDSHGAVPHQTMSADPHGALKRIGGAVIGGMAGLPLTTWMSRQLGVKRILEARRAAAAGATA